MSVIAAMALFLSYFFANNLSDTLIQARVHEAKAIRAQEDAESALLHLVGVHADQRALAAAGVARVQAVIAVVAQDILLANSVISSCAMCWIAYASCSSPG